MKLKEIIAILMILILMSCKKDEKFDSTVNQEEVITMNSLYSDYDSIVNRVKNFGDEEAYSELFYHLKDSDFESRTDTLMFYSKIMAEKYNYENAYIDYLDATTEKFKIEKDLSNYSTINLTKLQPNDKNQVINWLSKMVEKKIITQNQFDKVQK